MSPMYAKGGVRNFFSLAPLAKYYCPPTFKTVAPPSGLTFNGFNLNFSQITYLDHSAAPAVNCYFCVWCMKTLHFKAKDLTKWIRLSFEKPCRVFVVYTEIVTKIKWRFQWLHSIKTPAKIDLCITHYVQLQGAFPDPLTRGSAPGPRWGHSPKPPLKVRAAPLAIAWRDL